MVKWLSALSMFFVFGVVAEAAVVGVTVTKNLETVRINEKAAYAVNATQDVKSLSHDEIVAEFSKWTGISHDSKFVSSDEVSDDPGVKPSVSIKNTGDGTWTAEVISAKAGKWTITFAVSCEYILKDLKANTKKTVSDSGSGSCTFVATGQPFKIVLVPGPLDDFDGRSLSELGVGEEGYFKACEFSGDDITADVVFSLKKDPVIQLKGRGFAPELQPYEALDKPGNAQVIGKKDGKEATYDVSVILPKGLYLKMKKTTHVKGWPSAGFVADVCVTPEHVSFRNISVMEWGEDDKTGISKYKVKGKPFRLMAEEPQNSHLPKGWRSTEDLSRKILMAAIKAPNAIDTDVVYYGASDEPTPPFKDGGKYEEEGTISVQLPWVYCFKKNYDEKMPLTKFTSYGHVDVLGTMTTRKGGLEATFPINADDR